VTLNWPGFATPGGRLLLRRWQHDGPITQKDKGMVPSQGIDRVRHPNSQKGAELAANI
jgi:hypothetical protein